MTEFRFGVALWAVYLVGVFWWGIRCEIKSRREFEECETALKYLRHR